MNYSLKAPLERTLYTALIICGWQGNSREKAGNPSPRGGQISTLPCCQSSAGPENEAIHSDRLPLTVTPTSPSWTVKKIVSPILGTLPTSPSWIVTDKPSWPSNIVSPSWDITDKSILDCHRRMTSFLARFCHLDSFLPRFWSVTKKAHIGQRHDGHVHIEYVIRHLLANGTYWPAARWPYSSGTMAMFQ